MRRRLAQACACAILAALAMPVRGFELVFDDGFDGFGPVIKAWIHNGGTVLQCIGAWPTPLPLRRDGQIDSNLPVVSCPSINEFAADFTPSTWEITEPASEASEQAVTVLPNPIVVRLDSAAYVLAEEWQSQVAGSTLELSAAPGTQRIARAKSGGSRLLRLDQTANPQFTTARWATTSEGRTFASERIPISPAPFVSTGVVGALAMGDVLATGVDEIVGATYGALGFPSPYGALGLGAMFANREFRDMRVADLDGDGIDDVVSNVYDSGCTLVGLNRGGFFEFSEPKREDGSCVSGNGETVLVADFDEDGDNDVFIPFYQRFDLLINDGDGNFVDVAEERGISFPNYEPKPEGATAVDINRDGHVDIVVASEILLNDGTAHFTQAPKPFGPAGLFDEGLYVGDVDADGHFDIVKHDPNNGPEVFWGTDGSGVSFASSGLLLGVPGTLVRSFGLAVGDLTGNGLMDVVFAGGGGPTTPPEGLHSPSLCIQYAPRQFECVAKEWKPNPPGFSDLLLVTDVDGDHRNELVARIAPHPLMRTPTFARELRFNFAFDLRDQQEFRRQHGRTFEVRCAGDGERLALRHVDGGNGFLAQGRYSVSTGSDRCDRAYLDLYTAIGQRRFGPFEPGVHEVNIFAMS